MYGKLVQGDDDILGHIAYSMYKKQKAARIKAICNEKKVNYVPDEDLKHFIDMVQSSEQIELYTERAGTLANAFLEKSLGVQLSKEKARIESDFAHNHRSHGFMYGVWQSIVGSFLFLSIGYVLLRVTGSWERLISIIR